MLCDVPAATLSTLLGWPSKNLVRHYPDLAPLRVALRAQNMANAWTPADRAFSENLLLFMRTVTALCLLRVTFLGVGRLRYGRW